MVDVYTSIIFEYIEDNLKVLGKGSTKEEFKRRSTERWAAYELIESLCNHPFADPVLVIEDFIIAMQLYIRDCDNPEQIKDFKIAQDTAEKIILLFL